MDPLSVTVSIIAVLQAANAVISVCYDFRAAIKDAPWGLSRITNSIKDLRLVLSRLEQVANELEFHDGPTSAKNLPTLQALCQDGGALTNCFEELKALEQKLAPPRWAGEAGSKRRALIESVGWQLKEKDVQKTLKILEGCKSTLNLAISADQTALIGVMSKTMKSVDENTRSMFKQVQGASLDDRKRHIFQWLSSVDPSTSHEAALKTHQTGTNDWFLSCKEFDRWRDTENSFLWLSGFPGSGKTILMSTAINFLQQCSNQDTSTCIAYFYCDFRSPETRDPLNLAGSLISQICFQLGFFPKDLEEAFERSKMSAPSLNRQTDLSIFREILISLTSQYSVKILVDALDECERRQDMLELFRHLGKQGGPLKILLSSRNEADIRERLADFPRISLEAVSNCLDRDIDFYIDYRLDHDPSFRWLKPSFRQTIRESLSKQAKRMFRWLQCQLDQIAKLKTMKDIREALKGLPEGLYETYENILVRVPTGSVRIVRQILQWLICNVSTLTLAELHESLAIESDMDHIDEEAQLSSPMDIYDLCGNLIGITARGEVVLAHLSVKDYLLSGAIKSGSASAFALSETEANAENAFSCLTYLSFAELGSGPASSADDFEARLLRHPFLDYASRYWATYVRNANSSEELHKRVLQFFTPSYRPYFMSWLQVICSQSMFRWTDEHRKPMKYRKREWNSYPKHATSLYYAASFGLERVVRALLAQGAEVDAMGGRLGATAFHAATLRNHVQIMDILFQKGADPNKEDFVKATPLHSAALVGNVEVIKYLLDHGADPKARDDRWKTPYDWACLAGYADAQSLFEAAAIDEEN